MLLSYVVPAFNEEKNVHQLYDRLVQLNDKVGEPWELILINDGSRDRTPELIIEMTKKDPRVKFVDLSRNFGHQSALAAGLAKATGDAIISMDCDLQDPPEVIEQMIEKWKAGAKIVYARRLNFRKDNVIKRNASRAYYRILDKFSEVKIPRNVGDFRLVDKTVLNTLMDMHGMSPYFRGSVAWTGFSHDFVDYHRPDRAEGESGYTYSKLIQLGMDGFLNFSFLPLRLGLFLGVISIFTGMCLLAWMIFNSITTGFYYEFFKYMVLVLFILMGFLFILIWILGEYLGKVFNEVRNRPLYIVKDTYNLPAPTSEPTSQIPH